MPRYDYQCTSCGHEFELVQSFQEAGSGTCPRCSGAGRRHFHAVPVIYKGSGFYTTDYGRPKTPPEEGKEKETKKVEAGKTDAGKAEAGKTEAGKTEGKNGSAPEFNSKSPSAAEKASEAAK